MGLNVLGNQVNQAATSWVHWGGIRWPLVGCLALSWTMVTLCLIGGIQNYGKVVYFVTTFPYVVLTTLLAYVSTLDGFADGVHYYVTPDWEKLTELTVWKAAASQVSWFDPSNIYSQASFLAIEGKNQG